MPEFSGFSHLSLTVSDLQRSTQWYADVLGWNSVMQAGGEDEIRWAFGFLSGGIGLSLHEHPGQSADAFAPSRLGLDHASFAVSSRTDLESWVEHLSQQGVTCSPIVDVPYGAVLSFKDPDDIALELFVPPGQ